MSNSTKRTPAVSASSQQKSSYAASYIYSCTVQALVFLGATTWAYLKYHESLGVARSWTQHGPPTTSADRLAYAIQLQVFSLVPFFISWHHVALTRFFNPACRNPLAGNEHLVQRPNKILTNTVEQLLFSLVNVTAFATLVPDRYLCLVPYLVFLFVLGRIAFLVGYMIHPRHREYGVMITFIPTSVVFLYNLGKLCGIA